MSCTYQNRENPFLLSLSIIPCWLWFNAVCVDKCDLGLEDPLIIGKLFNQISQNSGPWFPPILLDNVYMGKIISHLKIHEVNKRYSWVCLEFLVMKRFGLVWLGLALCHINHCRLFNAKSIFIHINSSISNNSV